MRSLITSMLSIILLAASLAPGGPLDRSELFRPDVYPSQTAAVTALGDNVIAAIASSEQLPAERGRVELYGSVRTDVLGALARQIRTELPEIDVDIHGTEPLGSDPTRIRIEVLLIGHDTRPGREPQHERGEVTMTASGLVRHGPVSARYVEKPWADQWTSFVNAQPKKRWILARGDSPAASEAEALEQARFAAADQLLPLVRDRMNERGAGGAKLTVRQDWVRQQLASQLRSHACVEDSFVQRFERPYGDVWQASLLVDASAGILDHLARRCSGLAAAEFGQKAVTWGSVAGFILVLLMLYALVNALTRGYFLWRLRAAALLLSIVGILFVLAIT